MNPAIQDIINEYEQELKSFEGAWTVAEPYFIICRHVLERVEVTEQESILSMLEGYRSQVMMNYGHMLLARDLAREVHKATGDDRVREGFRYIPHMDWLVSEEEYWAHNLGDA